MRDVEDELKDRREEFMNIKAPDDMEDRLKSALYSSRAKNRMPLIYRKSARYRLAVASLLVLVLAFAFNYDVFAYYGKKILGYDNVTVGSIKELNNLGMGQEVNKSYQFKNGVIVTVNGVILDENKLVVMYSIRGDVEDKLQYLNVQPLKGILGTYYQTSGTGQINDKGDEIKWVQEFKSPSPFDRHLTFSILSNTDDASRGETARISFDLDMSKAIKHTVKFDINKAVEFEGTTYRFTTISATPLSVILKGKLENLPEDDKKLYSNSDPDGPSRSIDVEILETYTSGGKTVTEPLTVNSWGTSTGLDGVNLTYEFDGLKPGLLSLSLKVVKLEDTRIVDSSVDIDNLSRDIKVTAGNDEVVIKSVEIESNNTVITYLSDRDVNFIAGLMMDGKQAEQIDENSGEVQENGKSKIQRVVTYRGYADKMSLMFKAIIHETDINKQIELYK